MVETIWPKRFIVEPENHVDAVVAWCEANGLDARRIPPRDSLYLENGDVVYREFVFGNDGQLVLNHLDPQLTAWIRKPISAEPATFGLETT